MHSHSQQHLQIHSPSGVSLFGGANVVEHEVTSEERAQHPLILFVSHRTFLAWIFWSTAMMCNCIVAVWAQVHSDAVWGREHSEEMEGAIRGGIPKPLPDVGFSIFPYFKSVQIPGSTVSVPDLCMFVNMILVCLRAYFAINDQGLSARISYILILLKRLFLITGVVYFLRAVSIPLTLLPNPDQYCVPRIYNNSFLSTALWIPFGITHTCADVFFSGHAISMTASVLYWIYYTESKLGIAFASLVAGTSYFVLIASHFHYTNDVVYGIFLTWACWKLYHFVLCVPALMVNDAICILWWEMDSLDDSSLAGEVLLGNHRKMPASSIDEYQSVTSGLTSTSQNGLATNGLTNTQNGVIKSQNGLTNTQQSAMPDAVINVHNRRMTRFSSPERGLENQTTSASTPVDSSDDETEQTINIFKSTAKLENFKHNHLVSWSLMNNDTSGKRGVKSRQSKLQSFSFLSRLNLPFARSCSCK